MYATEDLSPEDEVRLRVNLETQYEFAVEAGVIPRGSRPSRGQLREALLTLTPMERRALQTRIHNRLVRIEEIMSGDKQTFEEPHLKPSDMPRECWWER